MPICNANELTIRQTLSESDQNASELAKIKRVRDQAYFNSYDFDAIEVLPTSSLSSSSSKSSSTSSSSSSNSSKSISGPSIITSISENEHNFSNQKPINTTYNTTKHNSKNNKESKSPNKVKKDLTTENLKPTSKNHGYFVRLKSLFSSSTSTSVAVVSGSASKNHLKSSKTINRQISDDSAINADCHQNEISQIKNARTVANNDDYNDNNTSDIDANYIVDDDVDDVDVDDDNPCGTIIIDRNSYNNSSSNSSSNSTTNLYNKISGSISNNNNNNNNNSNNNSSNNINNNHNGSKVKQISSNNGFILPRAILKYQNIEYSVNSMPSFSSSSAQISTKNKNSCNIDPITSFYTTNTATATTTANTTNGITNDSNAIAAAAAATTENIENQNNQHHYHYHHLHHDQFVQHKIQILQQLQQYSLDSNDLSSSPSDIIINSTGNHQVSPQPIISKTFTTSAAIHTTADFSSAADSAANTEASAAVTTTTTSGNTDDNTNHNKKLINSSSDVRNVDNKTRITDDTSTRKSVDVEVNNNNINNSSLAETTKYKEITIESKKQQGTITGVAVIAAVAATAPQTFIKTSSLATNMQRQLSQNYSEKSSDRSSSGCDHTNILSHYSTERSNGGSSGYYSSNLCSGSSIEEHIYSEPVIDNLIADVHVSHKSHCDKLTSLTSATKTTTTAAKSATVPKTIKTPITTISEIDQNINGNGGRSRVSSSSDQILCKFPKGLIMNVNNKSGSASGGGDGGGVDTTITKDNNFYMTNRSYNETYVGSNRRFFNNSSLRRSKYMVPPPQFGNRLEQQQQQFQLRSQQQHQQHHHKQGHRYGLYHNDSNREFTVNYVLNGSNNNNHNDSNSARSNTNQIDDIKNTKMNESLKNLETSIENLDRHLKNYPNYPRNSNNNNILLRPTSFGGSSASSCCDNNNTIDITNNSCDGGFKQKVPQQQQQLHSVYLPTIMEGIDSQSSNTKKNQQKSWTDDMLDDSLMDIDLDSFLLVNDNNNHQKNAAATTTNAIVTQTKSINNNINKSKKNELNGIDNPSFDANEILIREPMENNYKCSKYINSCPEDAYKVESELEHDHHHQLPPMIGNASLSNDKTLAFFLKKYEDQIHFQNTRDMLEDIQIKIRNIAEIAGEDDRVIPKAMEDNINLLKIQLEEYLSYMNHNSELEIKQFCTGVVNNQKLVTLTKAFERHRHRGGGGKITSSSLIAAATTPNHNNNSISCCNSSEYDYDVNYESVSNNNNCNNNRKRSCCSNSSGIIINNSSNNNNCNHLIYDGGSIIRGTNEILHSNNNSNNNNNNNNINNDNISLYGSPNGRNVISINDKLSFNDLYRLENGEFDNKTTRIMMNSNNSNINTNSGITSQMQKNLSYHSPFLNKDDIHKETEIDKNSILEWHRNKPSSWELYYGTNRIHHTVREYTTKHSQALMSYPSSRPESDFTLDLPRAEQLRLKMDKEKKFRQRCRILTTFLSLVFFLLTVMVVSLVLTRGKRMFGSML